MHAQISLRLLFTSGFLLLLSACASAPVQPPAKVEARDVDQTAAIEVDSQEISEPLLVEPSLSTQDLDLERARQYQTQAQNSIQQTQRIDATLSAAEHYIQAQEFNQAKQTIRNIEGQALSQIASDRLLVIQAYIAYSRNDLVRSLELLRPLWERNPVDTQSTPSGKTDNTAKEESDKLTPTAALSTQQVDALLLASLAYQKANDYDSALAALITRERALKGATRTETTRYIWQVINNLPQGLRQQIIQSTPNALVKNRLEQSVGSEIGQAPLKPTEFTQWRNSTLNQSSDIIESQWTNHSPRSIAILLPRSSRFTKAAQALMDGINYQHEQNNSPYRPNLRFYDLGQTPVDTAQYYNAAIQSGADFVIGPLGKDYANQLSAFSSIGSVPTILLGGDAPLNTNTNRFATTPEIEGMQIAERAWSDGHLSAAVMSANTAMSRRAVASFRQRWLQLGGKIAAVIDYSPKQFDHSVELKQMFAVNQSNYRHSHLSRTLGFKPKFSAYQRADIDFVFMYASNTTGRLLRPQINFFSGSKIPVYAASNIYNGIQDTVNNVDLNATRFPVMPWVIASEEVAPYAGQLNRLFALGADAYQLAASYQTLRSQPGSAFNGLTGMISIAGNGSILSEPAWARFEQGQATIIDNNGIDIRPVSAPNTRGTSGKGVNRENSYNKDTWNAEESTRRRSFRAAPQDNNN